MAASLKQRFGEEVEIKVGSRGQFDVLVDGKLVFSKAERGRFPEHGEVERAVAALKEGKEARPLDPPRSGFIERVLGKLKS